VPIEEGDRRAWLHAMRTRDPLLTDEEREMLVLAFLYGRYKRSAGGATEAEIAKVLEWAQGVRVDEGLLEGVLTKRLLPDLDEDGELRFRLTPLGMAEGKRSSDEFAARHGLPPLPPPEETDHTKEGE
jgi:hypothetical protein